MSEKAKIVLVGGSSGPYASWQAGFFAVLREMADVIRYDLASGATVGGLAAASSMTFDQMREMNRRVPGADVLRPVTNLERWYERKNLDLGGILSTDGLESWLASELEPHGLRIFADAQYGVGDDHPGAATHRVGISVAVWESDSAGLKAYSADELQDPQIIHREFQRAYFSKHFPFRRFEQVFAPDDIGRFVPSRADGRSARKHEREQNATKYGRKILPWLMNDFENESLAKWAAISCKQWPACLPEMLQNPETGEMVFIADGGHINNQPSRFNDGRRHYGVFPEREYPLINPRLTQGRELPGDKKRRITGMDMPMGRVLWCDRDRLPKYSLLDIHNLSPARRDEMFDIGTEMAGEMLPAVLDGIEEWFAERQKSISVESGRRNRGKLKLAEGMSPKDGELPVSVPALHGFRALPASKDVAYLVERDFGFRS